MRRQLQPFVLLITLCAIVAGCGGRGEYPQRPITLICPWAAGGGTDRVSRQLAAHLEQELKVPVSVVNATGGKGVTGHARGFNARPDGYTLTMATLELNMLHWSGLTDLSHEDCQPLMSVNEDYAALFVRSDATWRTLADIEAAIDAAPKTLRASGTSSGAAWHLALAGWRLAAGGVADDVIWISSTGANPSLQELISGGVDMVCCSLPEAAALFESGQIRAIGVMAPERVAGYEQVPTFAEQGCDWSLGGWRGIVVPLETPEHVAGRLTGALRRIVTGETAIVSRINSSEAGSSRQTFPEFMEAAGFDHTYREGEDFRRFLEETDNKFGALLTSEGMRTVNRDRYNARTFPLILLGAIGVTLLLLAARRWRKSSADEEDTRPRLTTDPAAWSRFGLVVAAVIIYCVAADAVGFLPIAGVLLLTMLWWFGTSVWASVAVVIVFVPAAYFLFGGLLRVPLPPGWWES